MSRAVLAAFALLLAGRSCLATTMEVSRVCGSDSWLYSRDVQRPRIAIARNTLPAAIDNGHFDSVEALVISLSRDEDYTVRAMIAKCTLPAAIDNGLFDSVADLVTELSRDQDWQVRGEIAEHTLPAAINKGYFDSVETLVNSLSMDQDRRLMDTTNAGSDDTTSAAARSGGLRGR